MKEIIAKCGYRCDLCLAYKINVEKNDRRELLSKGWNDVFGLDILADKIVCEGCVSCENPILIDSNCPVRKCVNIKGIETCAYCDEYICEKLQSRIVDRLQLEKQLGRKLTGDEYENIVKPYESKYRLDKIRSLIK